MELSNYTFTIIFIISFSFLFYSIKKKIKFLKIGISENRFDNKLERLKNVMKIGFGQSKILREPVAGVIHVLIFWGFIIFLFSVIESIIQGFYSTFSFHFLGGFYSVISFIQELFMLFVLMAVLFAAARRYIIKVPRLNVGLKEKTDAAIVLILIFFVVASMLGQSAASIGFNAGDNELIKSRFFSNVIFQLCFIGSSAESLNIYYSMFWWIHILVIFTFMNYLPYSKHFHVYTSLPNLFFQKLDDKKFVIKPIDLEDETNEQFGVADFEHLSWKQILDGYACTECGRCDSVCPAAETGKELSPRNIIKNIRSRTEQKAPLLISGNDVELTKLESNFVPDFISPEAIWDCTTCNACVYECPVSIEHLDAIIDLRRNLVLMEADFPKELNTVFNNLETNGSPWAFNSNERANWAEGMSVKTIAENPDCEYLFWVGCAGSFDARYKKVTQATAQLFNMAGVNYSILGNEEKCNGDTARRLGNEYLAQMMMQENIETLNKYGIKNIVTGCPHCFNSIKNEYPQFGGNFEVVHHTELLQNLVKNKKIKISSKNIKKRVTFHDSCYLGRYNDLYDSPRHNLNQIGGLDLIEMARNKDKGFCCGAGGGKMFLEETKGSKINLNRTKEALSTGAKTIASSCPFCMTMLGDGLKTFEKSEEVTVKDISEILLENSIK